MTAYDNPILLLAAFVTIAFVIFFTLKHRKVILVIAVIAAGIFAVGFAAFTIIGAVLSLVGEQQMMASCLTAHESRRSAGRLISAVN